MANSIRASGGQGYGANSTSLTIDLSVEGIVENDVLCCILYADESGTVPDLTITGMTGMTENIDQNPTTGRDRRISIFTKRMTASEIDCTMNISISQEHTFIWFAITGLHATTYLDVAMQFNSGANNPRPTNPAITPVTANGMLLLIGTTTHGDISAAVLPAAPTGLTLGEVILGLHRNVYTAYDLDYGAASTITPTQWLNTNSNTRGEWTVTTIAFRPGATVANISDVVSDEFDMDSNTQVDIQGALFEATQGTGKIYISSNSTLAGGSDEEDISSAIDSWAVGSVKFTSSALSAAIITALHAIGVGAKYLILVTDGGQETSFPIILHRPVSHVMDASTSVVPADTTDRGITGATGTFGAGRIEEAAAQNPSTTTKDIVADGYRHDAFVIKATTEARSVKYVFRLTIAGVPFATYDQIGEWTVTDPSGGGQVHIKIAGTWKTAIVWIKIGGVWKSMTSTWIKIAGVWKEI